MKNLFFVLNVSIALALISCTTLNPATGKKEYDPVKTKKIEAAVKPFVSGGISTFLANNTNNAPVIGNYLRSVGTVFCKMEAEKKFDPDFLSVEVDKIALPQIDPKYRVWVANTKNLLVAAYSVRFEDRLNADIPESAFVAFLARLFCDAINTGLHDAGQPGIPAAAPPP